MIIDTPSNRLWIEDPDQRSNEVLLKNYEHIYYWKKSGDETIVDLLKKPDIELRD